ncbi:hypothetical protein [Rhodopseudomonas pseudopalustris]|uniref:Uncharacterized protein n=1 Tax=Rhodopseudomonas pseudopalustris TaxID=1513892 RepID=A0A1H8WIF2_9BRAD|nr:hypothetical protein [Rhodopseudomonas pseudopalustris]SEP27445.1 hypothetical protein SAMN05444123_112125 [Rhodopseudomonas pseudopalustris]
MPSNRSSSNAMVLASAVANNATVDIGYPAGTSQNNYNAGNAGSGHYVMLNDNDKIAAGAGVAFSFGAAAITITNQSGYTWPAGTRLAVNADQQDGNQVIFLQFPLKLAKVANGDVVTEMRPGVFGALEYAEFVTTDPVTTAGKAASLNLEIDTTDVTGGVVALTSAAATPLGKVIAGSAITGNNKLTPASKLSLKASGVTAFAEGEGVLFVRVRLNQDFNY